MSVPEKLWRFPTAQAIANLAARFDVPTGPHMQDWAWEIADSNRLDEYLTDYQSGELTNDERFTLMEIIMQAFEDLPAPLDSDPRWEATLMTLDSKIDLHAYTVWYWSDLENELEDECWRVAPYLRKLVERHQARLVAT
ncbi:MAG: hypothetical protein WCJ09_29680 [Planctomycetota bacterium]